MSYHPQVHPRTQSKPRLSLTFRDKLTRNSLSRRYAYYIYYMVTTTYFCSPCPWIIPASILSFELSEINSIFEQCIMHADKIAWLMIQQLNYSSSSDTCSNRSWYSSMHVSHSYIMYAHRNYFNRNNLFYRAMTCTLKGKLMPTGMKVTMVTRKECSPLLMSRYHHSNTTVIL